MLWATAILILAAVCAVCTTQQGPTASTVRRVSMGVPWPRGLRTNVLPAAVTRGAQAVRRPATQRLASVPACLTSPGGIAATAALASTTSSLGGAARAANVTQWAPWRTSATPRLASAPVDPVSPAKPVTDASWVSLASPSRAAETVGVPHWVLPHPSAMRTARVCAGLASWAINVTAARTISSSWMVTQAAKSAPPAML